jgi:hypothetical protein
MGNLQSSTCLDVSASSFPLLIFRSLEDAGKEHPFCFRNVTKQLDYSGVRSPGPMLKTGLKEYSLKVA